MNAQNRTIGRYSLGVLVRPVVVDRPARTESGWQMNETSYYEYRDLILSATNTIVAQYAFYVSLVCAYLAATYFVGKKLTGIQAAVLTLVYLLVTLSAIAGISSSLDQYFHFITQVREAYPDLVEIPGTPPATDFIVFAVLFPGLLMSMLFMWLVRRRKST